MKRKLLLIVILAIAIFSVATPSLAAPTNSFQFTSVSPTSCSPGASVVMHFNFSVAPNDSRTDIWSLNNSRTGAASGNTAGPITAGAGGQDFLAGTWAISIPATTQANDTIVITVSMVSTVGQSATSRAAFNCSTGAIVPIPGGGATCTFTDGRVNCRAEDGAQTAAIYCTGDGGVTIWAVTNGVGKFAFTVTKDEIAKVPANPDKNTLIKKVGAIALYRLHGGKLQINAPNGYVFIWDGC